MQGVYALPLLTGEPFPQLLRFDLAALLASSAGDSGPVLLALEEDALLVKGWVARHFEPRRLDGLAIDDPGAWLTPPWNFEAVGLHPRQIFPASGNPRSGRTLLGVWEFWAARQTAVHSTACFAGRAEAMAGAETMLSLGPAAAWNWGWEA